MAKETRKIAGTVRHSGKLYGMDELDELQKDLTPEQLTRLTEKGVIEGFVKEKAEKPAKEK